MATATLIDPTPKQVMAFLVARRKRLKRNQKAIAALIGSSRKDVQEMEKGEDVLVADLRRYAFAVDLLVNVSIVTPPDGVTRKNK